LARKRTASVEAVSACTLLRLNPETFQKLLDGHADFKAQIEARIAQYDYKHVARVPLDFAEELLPAEASAHAKVRPQHVDQQEEGSA
jgi:ATP-binding cassette subfamily B protein